MKHEKSLVEKLEQIAAELCLKIESSYETDSGALYELVRNQAEGKWRVQMYQYQDIAALIRLELPYRSRMEAEFEPFCCFRYYDALPLSVSAVQSQEKSIGVLLLVDPCTYTSFIRSRYHVDCTSSSVYKSMRHLEMQPLQGQIWRTIMHYHGDGAASCLFYESKLYELAAYQLSAQQKADKQISSEASHRITNVDEKAITRLQQMIKSNPERDHSLSELATASCMSIAKLKYTFKSVTGMTAGQYRSLVRIALAKQLLQNTDQTLKEIAGQVGYQTANSFCAFFKKETGMQPTTYREQDCAQNSVIPISDKKL